MTTFPNSQSNEDNINYSLLGLPDTPPLSKQIKDARKRMGLSQRAFAEKVGITQAQLCRLETNSDTKPTRKTLKGLSPFLSKSYSELLVESGYSDVISPQEEYHSLSGTPINIRDMIESIFQVDPDLLKDLSELPQYGTPENILVLKKIIQIMKITEKEVSNERFYLLKESFQCLKKYILDLVSILITT